MGENLYCKGQKVLSEKGRRNFDRIFGDGKKLMCPECKGLKSVILKEPPFRSIRCPLCVGEGEISVSVQQL